MQQKHQYISRIDTKNRDDTIKAVKKTAGRASPKKMHKHYASIKPNPIWQARFALLYVLALTAFGTGAYIYLQNVESFEFKRAVINFKGAKQGLENHYQALQTSISAAETILSAEAIETDLSALLQIALENAKNLHIVSSNAQDKTQQVNQQIANISAQLDDVKKINAELQSVIHQIEIDLLAKMKTDLSTAINEANETLQKTKDSVHSELAALIAEAKITHSKSSDWVEVKEKKIQLTTKTNEAQAAIQAAAQAAARSAAANLLKKYAAQPIRRNVVTAPVTTTPCPAPVVAGLGCYSQKDAAWANTKVGIWQFGPTGCVPTAIAMVMRKYGSTLNPLNWGQRLYSVGLYNLFVTGGTSDSVIWAANSMSLWHDNISSLDVLVERLRQGYPVIALVRPPYTTPNTTHAIVLNGYNGGQTQILDPLGNRVSGWHSVADIFAHKSDDIVDYGTTGTVFTAIGYAPAPPAPPEPPIPPEPSTPPEPLEPDIP